MSGHSKWSNTKYRKSRQDSKKNKLFTKLTNDIVNFTILYGNNPNYNTKLKIAIDKALNNNMSKDTINKAIKRGENRYKLNNNIYEKKYYELKGPFNTLFIIECDINNNEKEIYNNILNLIKFNDITLYNNKSIIYSFKKIIKLLYINKYSILENNDENLLNFAINNNIYDIKFESPNKIIILTEEKYWLNINKKLINIKYKLLNKEKIFIPLNKIFLSKLNYLKILNIINIIKKQKFVKNIFNNFELEK